MASKYYLKLYHEILDDPKMMKLTDRLFSLTIKLFLLAGDYERDGFLPDIEDMTWRLRAIQDELETDLADLASTGIVQMKDDRWYVSKFAERQEPVAPTERWRRWKARQRKAEYYLTDDNESANEPQTKRLTDKMILNEITSDDKGIGVIYTLYEHEIGVISPLISDDINAYWNDITENNRELWFKGAIGKSAMANKRSWAYIKAILDSWLQAGRMTTWKQKEVDSELEKYR